MGQEARSAATPSLRYRTIVADPPWKYDTDGTHLRSSTNHRPRRAGATMLGAASRTRYGEVSLPELKALPVAEIAEDDAHLYLWTTNAMMVEAHELARAWGLLAAAIWWRDYATNLSEGRRVFPTSPYPALYQFTPAPPPGVVPQERAE